MIVAFTFRNFSLETGFYCPRHPWAVATLSPVPPAFTFFRNVESRPVPAWQLKRGESKTIQLESYQTAKAGNDSLPPYSTKYLKDDKKPFNKFKQGNYT